MHDFAFHASALGAGGLLQRGNVTTAIESLASTTLAHTGGEGRAVVSDFDSEEIGFAHAETRVFGRHHRDEKKKDRFTTSTYVFMRDLHIFDRVTVSRMGATLTSERGLDEDDDSEFEFEFSFTGIRVDGVEIEAAPDAAMKSIRRYRDLETVLSGDERKVKASGLVPCPSTKDLAARFHARDVAALQGELKNRRPVQGSVVENLKGGKGQKQHHKLVVPGLGVLIFGEFMLKPGLRRLTMIRVELGDPAIAAFAMDGGKPPTGSMTIASVEGNGVPIGP
jgi:hypothetical protein